MFLQEQFSVFIVLKNYSFYIALVLLFHIIQYHRNKIKNYLNQALVKMNIKVDRFRLEV